MLATCDHHANVDITVAMFLFHDSSGLLVSHQLLFNDVLKRHANMAFWFLVSAIILIICVYQLFPARLQCLELSTYPLHFAFSILTSKTWMFLDGLVICTVCLNRTRKQGCYLYLCLHIQLIFVSNTVLMPATI